jgi:hypothetical protein
MIAARFADHRIWGDIPDRIADLSELIFYDQKRTADAGSSTALKEISQLLPADRSGFDVVAGAEDAAELAVELALAGAANGLVLFQPALDGIPEEMTPVDFSGLEERARLFAPLLAAADEADAAKWRATVADVIGQAIGVHLTPQDAALVRDVMSSHADEIRHELQRALRAHAQGQEPASPAQPGQRWIDRLRQLAIPVSIVSTRPAFRAAEVLAARVPRGEAVLAGGEAGLPWLEDRDTAVAVLAAMVDRSR